MSAASLKPAVGDLIYATADASTGLPDCWIVRNGTPVDISATVDRHGVGRDGDGFSVSGGPLLGRWAARCDADAAESAAPLYRGTVIEVT